MRSLNSRERLLLALCFLTIFVVANAFIFRAVYKRMNGSEAELDALESELFELRQFAGDAEFWQRRDQWVEEKMPPPMVSVGRAQGELAEQLQQSLFEQKISIERQTLLEPVTSQFYEEVAVNLRIRGDAVKVNEWLTTLQAPESFQVIKNLELELDNRSKKTEPQAECNVTVARWFRPRGSEAASSPARGADDPGDADVGEEAGESTTAAPQSSEVRES